MTTLPARDPTQMMMGKDMLMALHEVGIIPADVYTTGGVTINIATDPAYMAVTATVNIVVPADKFRQALDIVDAKRPR